LFTLNTHFQELDKNIRPPEDRLQAAKELPPKVRDYLKEHEEFATITPHTVLVGSYAQHLSVGDVKDVDFLVRVPGDPESNDPEAKQLILRLKDVLDGLPQHLGFDGFTGVDIERARRSVHVYIKGRDFHLDVVPCIAPDGFDSKLYVPDRGFNKWVPSHPRGFVKLIEELDGDHGGKVRRLGRFLKHFRDFHMKERKPKSYWLGALLVYHVRDSLDMSEQIAVLFRDLTNAIYNQYASLLGRTDGATPNIPDPMLGHNISWNWGRSHFETFMRRLDDGRTWATKALEAEDREEAVEWWQKVFGDEYFPSDVTEAAKGLAAAGLPGAAFVSGSGRISSDRPSSGPSLPIPKTTYHGEEKE
jgi:hypothetical protein